MHDIKWIRENPEALDKALGGRNQREEDRGKFTSRAFLAWEEERRKPIFKVGQGQEKRNRLSKEIGLAKRAKDDAKAAELMDQVSRLKSDITHAGEQVVAKTEKKLEDLLAEIPNLPLDEVPDGVDEHGNMLRHHFGAVRNYAFAPKPHDDLGGALGFMDFETAAKLSGARFVVLKKGLARLERAIGQFMLDLHTNEHGYTEVNTPLLVRDDVMFGTGQLPKFSNDQFRVETEDEQRKHAYANFDLDRTAILDYVEKYGIEAARNGKMEVGEFVYRQNPDRMWLIPTAEVPLTNLVRESIIWEKNLQNPLPAC